MTTGTTILDGRTVLTVQAPDGTSRFATIGKYYQKSWSGGNGKVSKKKASVPSYGFPPRPDLENRLPNESSRDFKRRKRRLLNEWLALVAEWHRTHPKKVPKPRTRVVMPPCSYTMNKVDKTYGPMHVYDKPQGAWYTLDPAIDQQGHIPLDPKDHYAVIEKLRHKAYGSGFHPGITTAEGHKTLRMFFTHATQIRLALVALWNRSWRGIIRQLGAPTGQWAGRARDGFLAFKEGRKSFSQAWLCFAYGWRPLLKDMEDGMKWMAELLNGTSPTQKNRLSARKSFVKSDWISDSTWKTYRYAYRQRVTIQKVQYVITELRASPAFSAPSWASLAGVAWEVLPYSFVCDWVAPIGSYLQALRTSKDLRGTVVCSVLSHTYWEFPQVHKSLAGAVPVMGFTAPTTKITHFTRTISDELTPPTPLGDLSPSSVFSHWTRAVSAVALLHSLRLPGSPGRGNNRPLGHFK